MADKGEDYRIQQGNGSNKRVMTLETQIPQLSLTDVLRYLKSNGRSIPESPFIFFTGIYSFIPGLLIILEAALAEAAEHALQELADNPKHQQYNYNISHSFSFLYDYIPT